MTKKICEELIRRAKAGQTATYGEIAPLADLDVSRPNDRNVLSEMLGEISTDEHNAGRPMLSALVVRSEEQTPGPGFFLLARELGLWNGRDQTTFFAIELERVFEYWRHADASGNTSTANLRQHARPRTMPRKQSRISQWQDALDSARSALDQLSDALDEMIPIQKECSDSFDNMTEGLQQTERGRQYEAIADVAMNQAKKLVTELDDLLSDAEVY